MHYRTWSDALGGLISGLPDLISFDSVVPGVMNTQSMPVAQFQSWLSAADMPHLPQRIAVGWSGGADSTALLLALRCSGRDVMAWHVDHGWRDTSASEADQLSEIAAHWGVAFVSARLNPAIDGKTEAMARAQRYAQFQAWSQHYAIATLALAHHRDDQAETVCMRLLQGAGAGGCRGMWRERRMGELTIVRPLLHLASHTLRQSLASAGINWLDDPSNQDMHIWRNRIRHRLFPAMEKAGVAPDALFLRWQRQASVLAAHLDKAAAVWMDETHQTACGLAMPWSIWAAGSAPIRARVLQQWMVQLLGDGVTPGRRHIMMVEAWTIKSGRGGLDLSRCRLYRERDYLHLRLATSPFAPKKSCDSSGFHAKSTSLPPTA